MRLVCGFGWFGFVWHSTEKFFASPFFLNRRAKIGLAASNHPGLYIREASRQRRSYSILGLNPKSNSSSYSNPESFSLSPLDRRTPLSSRPANQPWALAEPCRPASQWPATTEGPGGGPRVFSQEKKLLSPTPSQIAQGAQ